MINEKIQNLLKELQRECEKEGVSALCTLHKEANALQLHVGGLPDVAALLAIQESELDNKLLVPVKLLRNAGLEALGMETGKTMPDHTFVLNNVNDIPDVLERIRKGEFE